ncbi:MAG: thioredoxin [Oscillospiraceae bacterium]|nr:thioredoxin [Oscillospiraceae bacterium]
MAEITLTAANFQAEVLDSPIPVLVDFWASWCGPCRMVAPVVAQIAAEQEGVVKVGKVNVDEEPGLAGRYGISSIPTLMVFRNGGPVNAAVGVRPKEQIEALWK